jgi:hypothetical protein
MYCAQWKKCRSNLESGSSAGFACGPGQVKAGGALTVEVERRDARVLFGQIEPGGPVLGERGCSFGMKASGGSGELPVGVVRESGVDEGC